MQNSRPVIQALVACIFLCFSFPNSTPAQEPSCTTPPKRLVDWWPGEGSANDITGSNNGTKQGGVTFTPGEVGLAFTFDGTGSVSFPSAVSGTSDFTIDFWLKTTSTNTDGILSNNRSGCGYGTFYEIRTLSAADEGGGYAGHLLVEFDQGDATNYVAIITTAAVNDGAFHHIAIVRQSGTVVVYIDGDFKNGGSGSTPGAVDIGSTLIAGVSACNGSNRNVPLTGQMDEIDLFNTALSADKIQAIFKAGTAGKCKGCQVDDQIHSGQIANPVGLVSWAPGGNKSSDGYYTTMMAQFTSTTAGQTLTDTAKNECGYLGFDWQQSITTLPCSGGVVPSPSGVGAQNVCLDGSLTASPSYPVADPPFGGYIFPPEFIGYNPFPFFSQQQA